MAALAFVCTQMGLWLVGSFETGLGMMVGGVAGLLCLATALPAHPERRFFIRLLLLALALRWLAAYVLFSRGLNASIGPDYLTYDYDGNLLSMEWQGLIDKSWRGGHLDATRSGWGMYYYVAAIYFVIGRNPLATQLINCALGAVTCLLVYRITLMVYPLPRVARIAALLTAVTPSMVLWTSQGLKESPIIFCLCLCTLLALRLCQRFRPTDFFWLILALFGLYSLRHYAFYIVFIAIVGALLFTMKKLAPVRILQGVTLVIILGLTFAYFGASEVAQKSFDLKKLQAGREWSAKVSNTGFGGDVDITDTRTALGYLPIGVMYVLLAPFPWQITSRSVLIMLPEMLVWWAAFPFLLQGFLFMARRRLLPSLPIIIFTLGLTLAYALYLTNVGTVHRQRTQLLVFFFVFVSVGWERWRVAKQMRRHQRLAIALSRRQPSVSPAISPAALAMRERRMALERR